MPKKYSKRRRLARTLLMDDRFKLGGKLYRILRISKGYDDLLNIDFYPDHASDILRISSMTIPGNYILKTYNQK